MKIFKRFNTLIVIAAISIKCTSTEGSKVITIDTHDDINVANVTD